MWWLMWVSCAVKAPDWVEGCDCPDGQICVSGGDAACVEPPAECAVAFGDPCDMSVLDEACMAAICGFVTNDSGIVGSYSTEGECWEQDGVTERHFDCDAPLTF